MNDDVTLPVCYRAEEHPDQVIPVDKVRLSTVECRIQNGDLLLFKGRSFFSRMIRFWTKSDYSHVAVALWLDFGGHSKLCAFEAMEGVGVRVLPLDEYLRDRQAAGEQVEWFKVTDPVVAAHRSVMVDYCWQTWGKHYSSWKQFVRTWIAPVWLQKRLGWWKAPEEDPARPFCSWVATAALEKAGFVPDGDAAPSRKSPADVARYRCLTRMCELIP